MLEEAVALARTVGDPRLLSMALCGLGQAIGEFGTARTLLEESLTLARQLGDGALIAQSLWILGNKSAEQGDWARARELLEECVSQARAAKNNVLGCRALADLAEVVSQQGDPERAKSLREEQLRMARERQTGLLVAEALAGLVAHAPSDEEALQWLAQSVRECGPGVVVGTLNGVAQHAPSYEAALRRIDQAARDYGPEVTFNPFVVLGNRARWQGDYDRAATCYRRMLVLSQQVGGPFGFLRQEVGGSLGIAQSLEALAGLAARQQQWKRAAMLLGAAEGVCAAIGATPSAWTGRDRVNAEEYERAVRGARAALGEDAFAAAWAEGRAMSLEEAVQFALA
jgi:tetratricopeptide (TPR) repeat protein